MQIINISTNNKPLVIHNNGPGHPDLWNRITNWYFKTERHDNPPNNLTIVTWNNSPQKGIAEKSMNMLGAEYQQLDLGKRWIRKNKIDLNVQALKEITTDYVMGIDSYDVIILSFKNIIDKFLSNNCDVLFSGELNDYPKVPFLREFEQSIAKSDFCHLNSGGWIGKTQQCLEFFKHCQETTNVDIVLADPRGHIPNDDQGITRKVFFQKYPAIRIDYECNIFQCLYNVTNQVIIDELML